MSKQTKSKLAFNQTMGDWRVTGSYDEPDNIIFYYKGKVHKKISYPGYKIWNIVAHLDDIVKDFEQGMAIASSDGLGGQVSYGVSDD